MEAFVLKDEQDVAILPWLRSDVRGVWNYSHPDGRLQIVNMDLIRSVYCRYGFDDHVQRNFFNVS